MVSKIIPNYANLYVGLFEENFSSNNPFLRNLKLWKRSIDDMFLLFQGTAEELHQFHSFINANSEHLKFTLTFDILIKSGVALAQTYTGSRRTGISCSTKIASTLHLGKRALLSANKVTYAGSVVHSDYGKRHLDERFRHRVTQRIGCTMHRTVTKIWPRMIASLPNHPAPWTNECNAFSNTPYLDNTVVQPNH